MKTEAALTVCLVEDDARVRNLMARWIDEEPGMRVIRHYPDAESAIRGLPADRPNVALVDINLGGLTGIDCVARLKPAMGATQFAMVTVYEDADKIFQAMAVGATGYLLKQTPRRELIQAIVELHAGGSPMSPNIARKVVQSFHQAPKIPAPAESELTARERQVLDGLVRGLLYKEIAESLSMSMGTLHTHIRRVYEKLHVHSRAQAMAKMSQR